MRRLLISVLVVPLLAAAALTAPATGPAGAAVVAEGRTGPAAKAAVRSVLQQTGGTLRGRLTSDRQSCVSGRDVYLIVRDSSQQYPSITLVATTNGAGRWSFDTEQRRGSTVRLAALTLGGPSCDIAQSNQITYDGARSGTTRAGGARLADVGVTLRITSEQATGRISSPRSVCTLYRPVFAFVRDSGTQDSFQVFLAAIGDRKGHYVYGEDGSDRGTQSDVISVVPGTNNCQPAQSSLERG